MYICCRHYYRRRPITWVIFSIVVTVLIVTLSTVSVRYTAGSYSDDDGLDYAPTDTRIVPVSNSFCQNLELNTDDTSDSGYTATLYMLNAPPMLTGKETFSFSVAPNILSDRYDYYYFYMYPGSSFTVSACISSASSESTFILIKGNRRFSRWKEGGIVPTKDFFTIPTLCNNGAVTKSYEISHEDNYFMIFDNTNFVDSRLQVDFNFSRTLYEFGNDTVAVKCHATTDYPDSCSVSVPLSGQTAFLTIEPNSNIDWTDGITLDISCGARAWMYFIVSLSVLVGVVAIIVPLLVCTYLYLRKKKQASTSGSATTATATTVTAATVSTDNTPLIAPPPPVNPKFEHDPPAYDTGFSAPPAYKP